MMNKWLFVFISIGIFNDVLCRPADSTPGGAPGAPPGASLPMSWLMTALPRTGIVGMFDNLGAALANFGNAQGSGFDAFISGIFNGFGNLFSGLFGSGAINTAFLNYNNRPPADSGPATPYVSISLLILL